MAKVYCDLSNASSVINNVGFAMEGGVMVSDEISQDVAQVFLGIPGFYSVVVEDDEAVEAGDPVSVVKRGRKPKVSIDSEL